MARKFTGDVEEVHSPGQTGRVHPVTPSPRKPLQPEVERRYIYNGDPQSQTPGYAVRPANTKTRRKKRRSTFNVITALFLSATGIILYIGNLLTVNELMVEVHLQQSRLDKILVTNGELKAEVNRKSAWERIGDAAKQLGLTYPKQQPEPVDVDGRKLEKFGER